jgi:predicted nucleotidyltransferase
MKSHRKQILAILAQISPLLREKNGVTKIGIFGSIARDQAGHDSDIDIVVEIYPDLFKRISLKNELESILGKKVDVVRYRNRMNSFLKKRIDKEWLYV